MRLVITLCILTAALAGCGGQLFEVAPRPAALPPALTTDTGALEAGAVWLNDELSLEQFDANLPLAGVIAIEVRLVNLSPQTIDLQPLRFNLRASTAEKIKRVAPKQALGRVMKYYGTRFYFKEAYRRTLEAFSARELEVEPALAPQAERRGVLYFDARRRATDLSGLSLEIDGAGSPIILRLN
jgi:hypothetical protein